MARVAPNLKHTVTAACLFCALFAASGLWAANTTPDMGALMGQLREAGPTDSATVARDIRMRWAQSGSDTIDLLLKRGRDALERGDAGSPRAASGCWCWWSHFNFCFFCFTL